MTNWIPSKYGNRTSAANIFGVFSMLTTRGKRVLPLILTSFLFFSTPKSICQTSSLEKARHFEYLHEDSCLFYADKAYAESLVSKDKDMQAESIALIISSFQGKGEYEKALEYCQSLKDLARKTGNDVFYAESLEYMGAVYLGLGVYDAAYAHLKQAIDIFQTMGENANTYLSTCYNALGVLAARQGDFSQAKNYLSTGLEYADSLEDPRQIVLLNSNLALCCIYSQEVEKGEQILLDQIQWVKSRNISYNQTFLFLNLCRICIEKGDYEKALGYGSEALAMARKMNNRLSEAQALYYTGYIYFITREDDKALSYLNATSQIASGLNLLDIRSYAASHMASIYESRGDYRNAYEMALLHTRLSDSLNRQTNQDNLYRLRHEYEYKEHLAQIEMDNKKKNRRWFMVSLVSVLSLLLFWALMSRQRIRMKNIMLMQNQMNDEIELKNREITTKTLYLEQKNKVISDIAERLKKDKHLFKTTNQALIEDIIKELLQTTKDSSWEEFELRFEQVHNGFFEKLNQRFPNLSPNEKKLCAYLKLNMSSKEIANLTHTTVGNVEQARFRLRKKFGIHGTDTNLLSFLEGL